MLFIEQVVAFFAQNWANFGLVCASLNIWIWLMASVVAISVRYRLEEKGSRRANH